MLKTNVIRLLEGSNVAHSVFEYDVSDGDISATAVANKIQKDPDQVFKTLVTIGKTTGYNVFIVPCECELDLKKAAIATGDKHIEMIKLRDLEHLTGYVHGGCSPLGMKKLFPTYIDEFATIYDVIFVNAGQVGLIVGLSPVDLSNIIGAKFCELT